MCSFAPAGPGEGDVPQFDAPAALQADAEVLQVPGQVAGAARRAGSANSGSRGCIEGGRTDPRDGSGRAGRSRRGSATDRPEQDVPEL